MGRKINRFIYRGKNLARSFLSELMESFSYLLYISAVPLSRRAIGECSQREISPYAVNTNINRLYNKGLILKIKKKKDILISFKEDFWKTKANFIALKRKKYSQVWDKKWRLIIYDIPESKRGKRQRLRTFLIDLGFGRVQDSCWVSPYDYSKQIYEFSVEEKILNEICIYEGKFFAGKNIDSLVKELWDLERLSDNYKRLLKESLSAIEFVKTEETGLKEYYGLYHNLYKFYRHLLNVDPFLPGEFIKHNLRDKTEKVFNKLACLIAEEIRLKM
ncbi:MAG: CRISPR-associated endonuclease Cas2 [Candidatus Omnitrophica bacterium]|nr:CRISPR-associated endonuclease Cas2 [Candidatus Omnitrophota bacterium]